MNTAHALPYDGLPDSDPRTETPLDRDSPWQRSLLKETPRGQTDACENTRIHSSRMRTGRSLTVCCSLLPGGGGFSLVPGGGSTCRGGFSLVGGGSPWGGSPWSRGGSPWSGGGVLPAGGVLLGPGGVFSLPGGVLPAGGVCLVWGGVCLVRGGSPETPPVYRITDTCKNITLATTSLRPVITVPQTSFAGGNKLKCE